MDRAGFDVPWGSCVSAVFIKVHKRSRANRPHQKAWEGLAQSGNFHSGVAQRGRGAESPLCVRATELLGLQDSSILSGCGLRGGVRRVSRPRPPLLLCQRVLTIYSVYIQSANSGLGLCCGRSLAESVGSDVQFGVRVRLFLKTSVFTAEGSKTEG